jgi:hypothetical protein
VGVTFLAGKKFVRYLNADFDKEVERQVEHRVSTIVDSVPTR